MNLEKASITVIQIDEAALREVLPFKKSEHAFCNDRVFYATLAFLVWKVLICVMVEKSKRKVFGEHVSISNWWISFYCVGQLNELKFYAMLALW